MVEPRHIAPESQTFASESLAIVLHLQSFVCEPQLIPFDAARFIVEPRHIAPESQTFVPIEDFAHALAC